MFTHIEMIHFLSPVVNMVIVYTSVFLLSQMNSLLTQFFFLSCSPVDMAVMLFNMHILLWFFKKLLFYLFTLPPAHWPPPSHSFPQSFLHPHYHSLSRWGLVSSRPAQGLYNKHLSPLGVSYSRGAGDSIIKHGLLLLTCICQLKILAQSRSLGMYRGDSLLSSSMGLRSLVLWGMD